MTSAAEVRTDPVFNDPPPTVIDGQSYTIREVKWSAARSFGMNLVTLLVGASEGKSTAQLFDGQLDQAEQLVSLSTGLQVAAIGEFPTSHVLKLASAVIEAHGKVLEELFRLRHQVLALVPRKNGDSGPPNSSSP